MRATPSFYVHGTSEAEQSRLTTLNDLINPPCLKELALRGDERILDVGSGLMQFTRAMARAVHPRGGVVAIESNEVQVAEARRQAIAAGEQDLVDLRVGDACDFPLREDEWGTFDLVHTRFLLEHLRNPQPVVDQIVRAAKPGGRIVLADDDHETIRLSPELPEFDSTWRTYMRTYEAAGCDPLIGRRLVSLLHRAGANPRRSTFIFFGACAGNEAFPIITSNIVRILDGARTSIESEGGAAAEPGAVDSTIAALEQWSRLPDAAVWYSICWAEGERPLD